MYCVFEIYAYICSGKDKNAYDKMQRKVRWVKI